MIERLLQFLIVAEMLFVNLSSTHYCTHKKFSLWKTNVILLICGILVIGLGLCILPGTSGFGNGNGMFVLAGFLFLIPLKYLYQESLRQILVIICTCWIYTMLVFSISVHVGKLFPAQYFTSGCLAIQSLLYLATIIPFRFFVKNKFVYILNNISDTINKFLQSASLMWFFTAVVVNLAFINNENAYLRLAALFCLAANAVVTYLLLHVTVRNMKNMEQLKSTVYIDSLTGLKNRSGLLEDADNKIRQRLPFTLIFMDLDSFKQVNDRFGHLAGDQYLTQFARTVEEILGDAGSLYRIAGDEFVCIYHYPETQYFLRRIEKNSWPFFSEELPFQGVSLGAADFPREARSVKALLDLADERMCQYKEKHKK